MKEGESRRYVRWRTGKQIQMKMEGGEAFFNCNLEDMNFLGMRISTALRFPQDAFRNLKIALTDNLILDVEVWVVWHKSKDGLNYYGLYFSKIKEPDKEKIYQFVRNYFPHEINKLWWKELGEKEQDNEAGDRRIFARFPLKVDIRYLDIKANKEGKGQTVDISAKGTGFTTDQELLPSTAIEIWIRVPNKGGLYYTRGEVVWSKRVTPDKYRVGVSLDKADMVGLSKMLNSA